MIELRTDLDNMPKERWKRFAVLVNKSYWRGDSWPYKQSPLWHVCEVGLHDDGSIFYMIETSQTGSEEIGKKDILAWTELPVMS